MAANLRQMAFKPQSYWHPPGHIYFNFSLMYFLADIEDVMFILTIVLFLQRHYFIFYIIWHYIIMFSISNDPVNYVISEACVRAGPRARPLKRVAFSSNGYKFTEWRSTATKVEFRCTNRICSVRVFCENGDWTQGKDK